ncbi:MAG: CARDB domain-containing protein [Promethearchaeota archaeon]
MIDNDKAISSGTFITNIDGKQFLAEYITKEKVEEMKSQSEFKASKRDYNQIIDGHGTGYTPPTAEDLEKLIGKMSLIGIAPESSSQNYKVSQDISSQIYFPSIGDQALQGSCTAWANVYYAYGYMEAKDYGWDASSGNPDYLLSPAWIYNKVAASDDGSAPVDVAQAMLDWGVSTLSSMPYNDMDVDSWGNEPAWREAPYHRPLNYNPIFYSGSATIDTIKALLDSEIPVTFGIDSNQFNFGFMDANYIISSTEYGYSSGNLNHAQCFVGYDDSMTDDGDIGAFRVVNSWGLGWGDAGYYWLTYDAFSEFGDDPYQTILYYDDRIDYNPSLISTWEFSSAPARMDDIITLGAGPHESPFDTITPLYDNDVVNSFPDFMALDISNFQAYYNADPDVLFFLELEPSTPTGTISSFLIERYIGGVLQETSPESPDVPKNTPGYVYGTFMNLDHDIKVLLDVPTDPLIFDTYNVKATIINNGVNDETDIDLELLLDGIPVLSSTIPSLLIGENTTFNYSWTPSEFKTYNFTGYTLPVPGETYISNNIYSVLRNIIGQIFFDDFEGGLSNWDSITGFWHLTDAGSSWPNPCYSPTHSMWFGQEITGDYDTGFREMGNITTIPLDLTASDSAKLEFYHWRESESGYDTSYVKISTDGINWDTIYSTSDTFYTWEKTSLDISSYVGNPSVEIMFHFDTLDSVANNYRGWLVDDIEILGSIASLPPHDLRVTLEVPDDPELYNTYTINATVINIGQNVESDVDLFLYLDSIIVDSTTISTLPAGVSETINYLWNPIDYDTYNFTVYAPPMPSETILENNVVTEIIIINLFQNYVMTPGAPYSWIDASGGTELYLEDDDYATIALPFDFTFYDKIFSTIYLSSNGYLSFTDPYPIEYNNVPFPSGESTHTYMIAPFWDDIFPPDGGHIYYQSFGTYWVAEWLDIDHVDEPILGSFEVVLYDTGEIEFNYDYLDYTGGGYTCGLNLGVDTNYYNSYQGLTDATYDFSILFTYPELGTLTITSPNISSTWETGTTHSITWTSTGTISDIKIDLFKDRVFLLVIVAKTTNDSEFSWTIPSRLVDSTQYQIKVSDVSNPAANDFSENFKIFTTSEPLPPEDSLTITNPDSHTVWETGTSQNITWTSTGSITNVKIELFKDGMFISEITASTTNDSSYIWDIPTDLDDGIDYQIKISDVSDPTTYDDSPNFVITSVNVPGGIPGYNILVILGILGVIVVVLIKNRAKLIK